MSCKLYKKNASKFFLGLGSSFSINGYLVCLILLFIYIICRYILIKKNFRKSVEIIPINEIYIMDVTTDIHKEGKFWNVIITLFLETTSRSNTTCHISSILNINEQSNIHNTSNVNLQIDTKSTILLKVPTVRSQ